jgi:hypothetical protein
LAVLAVGIMGDTLPTWGIIWEIWHCTGEIFCLPISDKTSPLLRILIGTLAFRIGSWELVFTDEGVWFKDCEITLVSVWSMLTWEGFWEGLCTLTLVGDCLYTSGNLSLVPIDDILAFWEGELLKIAVLFTWFRYVGLVNTRYVSGIVRTHMTMGGREWTWWHRHILIRSRVHVNRFWWAIQLSRNINFKRSLNRLVRDFVLKLRK